VALELQSRGWWLRSEIIWAKSISFNEKYSGSCMPESAGDRPTNGHEKFYLLSKSPDYFYDEEAVAEPIADTSRIGEVRGNTGHSARDEEKVNQIDPGQGVMKPTKKLRDVWTFNPASFTDEHFATFPLGLVEPCVKAGTPAHGVCSNCGAPYERETESDVELRSGSGKAGREPEGKHEGRQETTSGSYDVRMGGTPKTKTVGWKQACDCDASVKPATVLDPFSGAATTGIAALKHGRKYIGVDVNEDYNELAKKRIREHKDVPANHNFW
jgi:DNA modification methylase